MTLPPSVWDGVLQRLDAQLPGHVMDAWLRTIVAQPSDAGLRLLCRSAFHQEHIRNRLLAPIHACLQAEVGSEIPVELARLEEAAPEAPTASSPASTGASAPPAVPPRSAPRPARPVQRAVQYSFDSFEVGPCNALAREACVAVAAGRSSGLTPLFLAGSSGLGKTHLARAAAAEARASGEARVVYASAEAFTNEFLAALRARRTSEFKRRYRNDCDLLVLEDVQFLTGKNSTQLELFHTIDHLLDAGRGVVLTADRLPRSITDLDPRLQSTVSSGVVAELEPPDVTVRRRIVRRKAAAAGVNLPEACVQRIVEAVAGSVRDLEGALTQVVASSTLLGRPLDLALVESALRKLVPERHPESLDPETLVRLMAPFFGLRPETLSSRSRRHEVLVPRQITMYLCRHHTGASLSRIGRAFQRDHPAVANAIQKVEQAILSKARLRYQLEAASAHLEEMLTSRERPGPVPGAPPPARG